jgi:hypothetical protein
MEILKQYLPAVLCYYIIEPYLVPNYTLVNIDKYTRVVHDLKCLNKNLNARKLISKIQLKNIFLLLGQGYMTTRGDLDIAFHYKLDKYNPRKTCIRYRKINRMFPIYYNQ